MAGNSTSSPNGLTLRYFKHFVEIHGGREVFHGLTSMDVCMKYLLPYTASTQLSLVDHVLTQENHDKYVQPAQWFISHSWSYNFLDLIDSLDAFVERIHGNDSISFWFCVFCNNQHQIQDKVHEFNHWFQIFESSLRSIGNVVMVFDSWNDPGTLKRAWCVFEVYVSIIAQARFEVAMPAHAESIFENEGSFYRMLSKIKSEHSQTTISSDRDHIFSRIQEQVGFQKLDRMVFDVLDRWMIRTVQHHIDSTPSPEDKARWLYVMADILDEKSNFKACQGVLESAIAIYEELEEHSDPSAIWRLRSRLAFIKARTNQPREEWTALWEDVLYNQTKLLSREHKDTLHTLHNFGMMSCNDGTYTKGLSLLKECLDIKERVLGTDDMSTLTTMSMYVPNYVFRTKHLDVLKAEELLESCFLRQCRVLGEDHLNTNQSRNNLSVWYIEKGKYQLGVDHFKETYRGCMRILGTDHPITWMCCINLGQSLIYVGDYAGSESTLLMSLDAVIRLEEKRWISICYRFLGTLYHYMNQFDKSSKYFKLAMETLPTALPTNGEERMRSTHLYVMYQYFVEVKPSTEELNGLEMEIKNSNWDHETWTFFCCHGCYEPIQGSLYNCKQCRGLRLCSTCLNERPSHTYDICKHDINSMIEYKPATRWLHEKKLEQLAQGKDWVEYNKVYQDYQTYCIKYHIPLNQRLKNQHNQFMEIKWKSLNPSDHIPSLVVMMAVALGISAIALTRRYR